MNWGRPLRYEPRLVPAIAAALSLAMHGVPFFAGFVVPRPGVPVKPRLHARVAQFALTIAGGSEARPERGAETVSMPLGRRPTVERESITGPRPRSVPLPATGLARTGHGAASPAVHVGVTGAGAGSAVASSVEGGVRAARLLRGQGEPRYPAVCQRRNLEGDGEYLLAIDETGRVTDVKVSRPAGHPEFDNSATLFFLYRARYEPATLEGVPIPFTLRQKVAFELERK